MTNSAGTNDAGAALPRAQYQVLGKTRYDQTWIDKTIEGEIAGFGFARPQKRPASLDGVIAKRPVVVSTPAKPAPIPLVTTSTPAVVTVAPPKTALQKLKDRADALNGKIRKLEGR